MDDTIALKNAKAKIGNEKMKYFLQKQKDCYTINIVTKQKEKNYESEKRKENLVVQSCVYGVWRCMRIR